MSDITAAEFRTAEKVARSLGFVTAQSYADHAARLESEGTVPAGGMALTAEQAEDVRKAREALRGYRNFEGSIARGHVRSLVAAVDALFPATEPAEEETKAETLSVRLGRAALEASDAVNYGSGLEALHLAVGEAILAELALTSDTKVKVVDGCTCWPEDRTPDCYVSSPVVPAPTETEAEVSARCREHDPYGRQCMDYAGHVHPHRLVLPAGDTHHWETPAPTETGPWQRIEDVPANVTVLDCDGLSWSYVDSHWRCHEDVDGPYSLRLINDLAPFVAAEEG